MLMVTSTKVNGAMIKLMVMVHTHMPMGPPMLVNGLTINNTVKV